MRQRQPKNYEILRAESNYDRMKRKRQLRKVISSVILQGIALGLILSCIVIAGTFILS